MIYFFDVNHELVKVVTSENIVSARHEQELNGIIISDIELNLSYTKSFIEQASLFGYYYKGTFYLHNIQRVEDFHGDDLVSIHGRHIFFNDMQYGKLIEDVRPTDRNAYDMLAQTIETNTRWSLDFHATTGRLSTNFYWKTPYEVLEWVVNNFRLEYEPRILFDGQQINGYMLHINNALGDNTGIRIPYGDRVLSLTHDVDYSEVITRLAPRGRGELLEGGSYGRRINIKDVEVNQDGIVSPIGDYYLEDTSISHQYESDRHAEIIFEDIEDVNMLIEEGISAYQDMSRPKMNFEADVQDIGDVNIGDSVAIIRHEYEIYFNARVHMITVDLLNESDAQVELGDYQHFKESKSERAQRRVRENLIRESERFDREVQQMREAFDQALIDAHAEIAAIDANMTAEIANEIASFETEFNAEVQAAKDLAEQQIAETEQRINTTINTTRGEIEQDYNQAVTNAREYAEQQAEHRANVVRGELNTFAGVHSQIVQDLEDNVMDIDDFLGDISGFTLDDRLQDINLSFQERIDSLNLNTANMVQGTRYDEPSKYLTYGGVTLVEDDINYFDLNNATNHSSVRHEETVKLEADTDYYLVVEYKSADIDSLDYLTLTTGGSGFIRLYDADTGLEGFNNLIPDGDWRSKTIRINLNTEFEGMLRLGTRWATSPNGTVISIRQPYLTNTLNRRWLPHPNDATQSIEQIVSRIVELEDGRQTLITRSEYNFDTGKVNQTIADITETVDTNKTMIANIEDYDVIKNGSLVMQTVNGFEQKVWDTTEEIQANLIPQSANAWVNGRYWSGGSLTAGGVHANNLSLERSLAMQTGSEVTLTMSDESVYVSSISHWLVYFTNYNGTIFSGESPIRVPRGQTRTFTVPTGSTHVLISAMAMDGFSVRDDFIENPNKRINVKLEIGGKATPMLNAISHIEQLSSEVSIAVQELDGEAVRQSDITVSPSSVRIGSTQILGDDVLASILNVSPSAIDMITQKMRLSGDLYVDGDITALAISAVEGNFARLFASEFESVTITGEHIEANTINVRHLTGADGILNLLMARTIFSDRITTLSLDVVEGNFARLFASEIETVNLNASNITTGTLSSARLAVNNALINRLISNSILTSEMRSQSLTAVYGDIAELRTRVLTSEVIESDHINVNNALIDKLFAREALIERLTSKTAFIRNIQAIDLAADQVRVGFNGISNNVTINTSGVTINNGALTVHRTDNGAPTIIGGHNPNGVHLVPSTPARRDPRMTIDGQYARRANLGSSETIFDFYMFEHFYTDLMLDFAIINYEDHPIRVRVTVRGTDGSTFERSMDVTVPNSPTRTAFPRMVVNLGVPQGTLERFFVIVRNVGTSDNHGAFGIHTYMVKHLDNGHGYPRLEYS